MTNCSCDISRSRTSMQYTALEERQKAQHKENWCFEPSLPQRITSGLIYEEWLLASVSRKVRDEVISS